ncbi:MAG: hypothetical protein KBC36_07130 [Spirochaetia bacterium]|nr:hypothetical protein [Spirochaetia bacterium]
MGRSAAKTMVAAMAALAALGIAAAQGKGLSAFIMMPEDAGVAGEALERMQLDAAMAALGAGGRVERSGSSWRWSAGGSVPYRAVGKTELARKGGWILLRAELEPGRPFAPLPAGKNRKVVFTLDELLAAPYGTRSPELHAVFMATRTAGRDSSGARIVSILWNAKRSRFEATVRLAK